MNPLEVLKELFDEEMDRVFGYSANYLMTKARTGYEHEHRHHTERADVLKGLIEEMGGQVD